METLLKAQLKALEELREASGKPHLPKHRQSPSHVDMAENVLRSEGHPLHAFELLDRIEATYGVRLNRESLVSALLKHTARGRFVKTGKNTFGLPDTGSGS
jgi:hypothetical protein